MISCFAIIIGSGTRIAICIGTYASIEILTNNIVPNSITYQNQDKIYFNRKSQ